VQLVKAGQEASVTARVLGMPKATLNNWVRASEKGVLQGAGDKPVSAEQVRCHHKARSAASACACRRAARAIAGTKRHRRLHVTLGYISPMKYEEYWHGGRANKAA
jgi:hypothetical protein